MGGQQLNLVDLSKSLNLTTLVKAMKVTGLSRILNHEGPFTLFAPVNSAFTDPPLWARDELMQEMLQYHVMRKEVKKEELHNDLTVRSLLSKRDVRINLYNGGQKITANGEVLSGVGHEALNGRLYMVNNINWSIYQRQGTLLSELSHCPDHHYSMLIDALHVTGISKHLSGDKLFTLLAPSDEAFGKLAQPV